MIDYSIYPYDIKQPEGKWPRPATEEELHALFENTKVAAKHYPGDEMFTGACRQIAELPTKELLFDSISHDMTLRKSFFLKVYGYEISFPGYADKAIKMLEEVGCSKARQYYEQIVGEHQKKREEGQKEAAKWLREQIDNEYERKVKEFERKEGKKDGTAEQKPIGDWHRFKGFPSIQ